MREQWLTNWGQGLALAGCEACDWLYLLPLQKLPLTCPHCGQMELELMDAMADSPIYTHPPELLVPFVISPTTLQNQIQQFAGRIWFAPPDLQAENLIGRLQPIYIPMWLVDADVQAHWQAEVGYNYQIVSHRDQNVNGRWQSQQIQKTKVRWEPRLGTLSRRYNNTAAPALEDHRNMMKRLGDYDRNKAQPYQTVNEALVRLPNRPPEDAWTEAMAALYDIAKDDCCRAANGDRVRDFKWSAEYANQNWTQLLLPLYTTFYLDDENQPQMLLVNGQTGELNGRQRASMKRAFRTTGMIATVTVLLFLAGLVLTFMKVGGGETAVSLSFFTLLAALIPIIYVWYFNQTH